MIPFEYGIPPGSPSGSGSPYRARAHALHRLGQQREQRLVEPVADDVVRGEHDPAAAGEGVLGDDVDRGGLHLDEVRVRVERRPARRAARRGRPRCGEAWTTSASRCDDVGRPGGEDGDAALERLERPQPQRRGDRALDLAVDRDDEVGDEPAVGVEVRVDVVAGRRRAARAGRRRSAGSTAPLESKTTTSGCRSAARRAPVDDVRDEDLAREPAARPPAADRRHAADRGDLEVVRGRVPSGARELDEVGDRRPPLDHLRLGRPAAAHRHDDDVAVAREQRGEVRRRAAVLPTRLPGADHGDRRQLEVGERGRVEPEVGADVRQPGRERLRGPAEALLGPEHGLVGEVDHDLRVAEVLDAAARRSRRRRAASRSRRRGSRRPTRTAARRAPRARPPGSAPRR